MDSEEKKELLQHFEDGARKPAIIGKTAIIPKLFEDDGDLRTAWATPDSTYRLSFAQLHFLKTFEDTQSLEKACVAAHRSIDWGRDFLVKHQSVGGYLWERAKIKQLSTVATPDWTKAKAVEGVMGTWKPDKAQVECLKLVKDINFPKAALSITQNNTFLQIPKMSPEEERAIREFADRQAKVIDVQEAKVA
jgi:hypothetical protein